MIKQLNLLSFLFSSLILGGCSAPMISCFEHSPEIGTVNSFINFDGSCSENGYSFIWNFGDNTGDTAITTSMFVSHIYSMPGDYTVTLMLERKDGPNNRKSEPFSSQVISLH